MNFAQFSAIKSNESIDTVNGIIKGVSVITEGEAMGRNAGTFIDSITLSQIHSVASKFPDGVKVKLSQQKEHDGSAGQIVGVLKDFRIDGKRVRADLHLLKSDENYAKILEMSATMPSEFGLSVVVPSNHEKVDGKSCLRCKDIFSIDLVESPAANAGLFFSTQTNNTTMSSIKYAKGEDGDHAKDCECKECMSKHSKKEMSAYVASLLGLPETATEDEIKSKMSSIGKPADLTALTSKIEEATTKLSALEAGNANAVALSQKAEIDNLVAEAVKDGRVVPFDNEDLYVTADGKTTIKMLPTQLSKVISKLPKGVIALSKRQVEAPKGADGKPITDAAARVEFCRAKKAEGAILLSEMIQRQTTLN